MPRETGERLTRRRTAAAALCLAALAAGCRGPRVAEPPVAVSVSLDRETCRIGEPVVATVRLESHGTRAVDVPAFDHTSLKFLYGAKAMEVAIRCEPVFSALVAPEPLRLEPGQAIERRFLFTRLTGETGDYSLIVTFKGAIVGKELAEEPAYARPVSFSVTEPVALKRDPANGLILKAQAIELATQQAGGKVEATRAVLMPLGKTELFTWVVMLRTQTPGGEARSSAVQVSPYTGRVQPLELKEAAAGSLVPVPGESSPESGRTIPRMPQEKGGNSTGKR